MRLAGFAVALVGTVALTPLMPTPLLAQVNLQPPRPLTGEEEAEDRQVANLARDFFANVVKADPSWLAGQKTYVVLSSYDAPTNEIVYRPISLVDLGMLLKSCSPDRFGRSGSSDFVDENHEKQTEFDRIRSQPWRGVTTVSEDSDGRLIQWEGWSTHWVCESNAPYDQFDIMFQRDGDHLNFLRVVTQFSNRGR